MKQSNEVNLLIEKMLEVEVRDNLSVEQVRAIIPRIFERGLYVSSMEAIELAKDGSQPLRVDFSILGLDELWDEKAAVDPAYARGVLEAKLAAAEKCENAVELNVWLDDLQG